MAESPDYGETRQTPPIIDPTSISPSPHYQFAVNFDDPNPIYLEFRSDDAGEGLKGAVFVDYQVTPRETFIDEYEIPAGPFDRVKKLSFSFDPGHGRFAPGCHTLSVLVMHASTFDTNTNKVLAERFKEDGAVVTWWFVATDANNQQTPDPCPTAAGGESS